MQDQATFPGSDSPEERKQKRTARRWKRRFRIFSPFLGVTALVLTLGLSVDLIEYQPAKPVNRLSDRPIPQSVLDAQQRKAIPMNPAATSQSFHSPARADALITTQASESITRPIAEDQVVIGSALQTTASHAKKDFAQPKPPYALRGRR